MANGQYRINSNSLNAMEKKMLFKETYQNQSYFIEKFEKEQVKFKCQPFTNSLRQNINRLLLEKNLINSIIPLENLHTSLSDEMRAYDFNDGINKVSTYFYDTDEHFNEIYLQFIRFIRQEIVKEAFYFQTTPTIRIHCPNAINSHHYPRYHSDISYGHPPEEINLWIPLTHPQGEQAHGFRMMDITQSNSLLQEFDYDFTAFIESSIHDKTFSKRCEAIATQVDVDFGEILAFDSRCIHSGEALSQHTRASMDIRVLPISEYEKMSIQYQGLGRRKILFMPGHCYHAQHSDVL